MNEGCVSQALVSHEVVGNHSTPDLAARLRWISAQFRWVDDVPEELRRLRSLPEVGDVMPVLRHASPARTTHCLSRNLNMFMPQARDRTSENRHQPDNTLRRATPRHEGTRAPTSLSYLKLSESMPSVGCRIALWPQYPAAPFTPAAHTTLAKAPLRRRASGLPRFPSRSAAPRRTIGLSILAICPNSLPCFS